MTATAVIPHWNRRDLLETLLRSLGNQTQRFDEVIVADNGSTDDSAQLAAQYGARVIQLGRNLGFAAAVNRGIAAAQGGWIAILNNDVTLDPVWLATLTQASERDGVDFATGKLLRADPASFTDTDQTPVMDGAFDEVSRGA